ncbi:pyridoxamine 5'-phosphate oxidase family protein [Kitasatospora sp. NPDC093806]|uniref:pyridoxamine 5'-phosphate oxidase family protein n=1 Tax=Kitasatospora sp. NPDC093806 TaxID=3155075 RepID=UPI0034205D48
MITNSTKRQTAERVRDTLERLTTERDIWVSTSHPEHGPHQVPLWFRWDGQAVWMCTSATSATARNIQAEPRVQLALPDTFNVVALQGEAEGFPAQEVPAEAAQAFADRFSGWDPRTEDRPYLYIRVTPKTVRAWHGEPELSGRVIMRDGTWL